MFSFTEDGALFSMPLHHLREILILTMKYIQSRNNRNKWRPIPGSGLLLLLVGNGKGSSDSKRRKAGLKEESKNAQAHDWRINSFWRTQEDLSPPMKTLWTRSSLPLASQALPPLWKNALSRALSAIAGTSRDHKRSPFYCIPSLPSLLLWPKR